MKIKKEPLEFKEMLGKYIGIKGLDIIVNLKDGKKVELLKNRELEENEIVMKDLKNLETRIPISRVKSIDLFAM